MRKRVEIVHRKQQSAVAKNNGPPNRSPRFVHKVGLASGNPTRTPWARKIYLLPNFATQSPRGALSSGISQSRGHRQRRVRVMDEFQKRLQRRHFMQS